MRIIKINFEKPDKKIIKKAAKIIKNGGIIVYPTDTVYGIGANVLDKKVVEKVFKIKQRQKNKPLSVIVKDIKMAKKFAQISFMTEKILAKILPGAITVILKGSRKLSLLARIEARPARIAMQSIAGGASSYPAAGNFNSIGIRIPNCKITKLLSSELKIPFTATSANISGKQASGKIQEIIKQFQNKKNKPDLILDAGDLPKSKPSTIIDLTSSKPKILRSGEISREKIFKIFKNMNNHGIVAIIIKDKKFLLLKDSRDLMLDYWGPPHGRCEEIDLTEENCVIREVLEETNLNVKPIKKLWTTKADTKVKTVTFWLVEIISGNMKIDKKESSNYGWFILNEALKLKLYPGTKKFLKLVKENKIKV